jgi:hypothetical protein
MNHGAMIAAPPVEMEVCIMEQLLRFLLSDAALNALVELVGRLSPLDRELWDTLMAEVERRLRGESGGEVTLPRRVFDGLPAVVQNLFARLG